MTLVSEEPHETGQLKISMNYDSTFAAGQNSVVYIVNNCGAEDYTIDMAGNSAVSCFFLSVKTFNPGPVQFFTNCSAVPRFTA